jgi:phosphoribosyl 1,2-cyclic phosphate phosphodiesterase
MIQTKGKILLIDAGPDFREQMLRYNTDNQLDAILLTHEHRDHIAGLDDVRPYNFIQKRSVPVYAEKNVLEAVKNRFSYSFVEEEPYKYGVPKFDLREIRNKEFYIDNIKIQPIRVYHSMPMFGYRIGDFAYITDAKKIEDEEKAKLTGVKILVVNALRIKEHPTHFNLEEALKLIKQIQPQQAYLTHMSHKIGKHSDLEKKLPKNVKPAYDGLVISSKIFEKK